MCAQNLNLIDFQIILDCGLACATMAAMDRPWTVVARRAKACSSWLYPLRWALELHLGGAHRAISIGRSVMQQARGAVDLPTCRKILIEQIAGIDTDLT
jgi:hypothetical protein